MSVVEPRGRKVALYGYLGSGNLGNDASFETLMGSLRQDPVAQVSAITIAPEAIEQRYDVPARQLRSRLGRWFDAIHTLAVVNTVDIVAVPGMGVLEETLGTRFWGLPLWLFLVAVAARLTRRRFALVAVGAEPVRNPLTRWFFRATVRMADHVSYRDQWSAQSAGEPEGRVTPDLVFAHPALTERPARPPTPGTVLVGVLDWHGWADDRERGTADHAAYVDRVVGVVRGLLARGDRVLLTGGDRVDDRCAAQVRAAVLAVEPDAADRVELRPVPTYRELVDLVDETEAVVGTRFHTLVCALSRGRPVVAVAYAEKSTRLLDWFGLPGATVPIDDWQPDDLLARLDTLRARPELPALLSARAAEAAEQVGRLLSDVNADLQG